MVPILLYVYQYIHNSGIAVQFPALLVRCESNVPPLFSRTDWQCSIRTLASQKRMRTFRFVLQSYSTDTGTCVLTVNMKMEKGMICYWNLGMLRIFFSGNNSGDLLCRASLSLCLAVSRLCLGYFGHVTLALGGTHKYRVPVFMLPEIYVDRDTYPVFTKPLGSGTVFWIRNLSNATVFQHFCF
jgi:hypothetical protein